MSQIVQVSEIVETNGKTIKQNNLETQHTIPMGALVELNFEDDYKEMNGLRLFVVAHLRDCDGSPLYAISHDKNAYFKYQTAEKEIKDEVWKDSDTPVLARSLILWKYHEAGGAILFNYPDSCFTVIKT